MLPDLRGGLFCDEPGLGKTITGLALILHTCGTWPRVPPGAKVLERSDANGARLLSYIVASGPGHGELPGEVRKLRDRSLGGTAQTECSKSFPDRNEQQALSVTMKLVEKQ